MTTVLAVGGLFALAAVLALVTELYRSRVRSRRRREVASAAAPYGWVPAPDDQALHAQFDLHPFGYGTNRHVSVVFRGQYRGAEAIAFDYELEVLDGESNVRYVYNVLAVRLGPALGDGRLRALAGMLPIEVPGLGRVSGGVEGDSLLLVRGGKGAKVLRQPHWAANLPAAQGLVDQLVARVP